MSHKVKISSDEFKKPLEGYILNDDFYEIQELFDKARKKYEKLKQDNTSVKEE